MTQIVKDIHFKCWHSWYCSELVYPTKVVILHTCPSYELRQFINSLTQQILTYPIRWCLLNCNSDACMNLCNGKSAKIRVLLCGRIIRQYQNCIPRLLTVDIINIQVIPQLLFVVVHVHVVNMKRRGILKILSKQKSSASWAMFKVSWEVTLDAYHTAVTAHVSIIKFLCSILLHGRALNISHDVFLTSWYKCLGMILVCRFLIIVVTSFIPLTCSIWEKVALDSINMNVCNQPGEKGTKSFNYWKKFHFNDRIILLRKVSKNEKIQDHFVAW